ncbi:thioredoxin family protein [Costertonia aggregata]|uniref:Thioredoxin family protein n=1 Tax=Costertonia aggregata TaxID=343403 RepID=A0A7H9AS09_9FLAO|nr:thioredoxin family protein [Costertonia aggregata]QLG46234.1 thioredoxin family protein [Costertonia aggregata]
MKSIVLIVSLCFSMVLLGQDWENSYSDALTTSRESDKPIVLVFSGSDWCAPCIKLDQEIWRSQDFLEYSKDNYVLYRADFPRKKKNTIAENLKRANAKLAESYNPKGFFPLVVVLDKNEKVLGKTGYKKLNPNEYIALLNSFVE